MLEDGRATVKALQILMEAMGAHLFPLPFP